jgi:hypothetical protein
MTLFSNARERFTPMGWKLRRAAQICGWGTIILMTVWFFGRR